MSGAPNPTGIQKLRALLILREQVRANIVDLNDTIHQSQVKLADEQRSWRVLHEQIDAQLRDMDVKSPGNHGFEARYIELLDMLVNEPPAPSVLSHMVNLPHK